MLFLIINMNQNVWGPAAWLFIHSVALCYPPKPTSTDMINYKNFFTSLKNVLPCKICRKNYNEHLTVRPIRLDSRLSLFHWTIDIHNEVNKKENKRVLSYEEVHKLFENLYGKQILYTSNDGKRVSRVYEKTLVILMVFLLIIIIILLFRKSKCRT